MPVEDTKAHPSTVRTAYRAGCHSRKGFVKGYMAQDGWNYDGTRRMKVVPHTMSIACRQILPLPECEGCTAEKDHEYIEKMRGMK
jgi:hypothetical protein